MKKNRNETNDRFYTTFRNGVVNDLKNSKMDYFQNYFATNIKTMKNSWTVSNSIISWKSFAHVSIDGIQDVSGKSVTDLAQMLSIITE